MWPTPPPNVKSINKHTVLDLIRFSPGGISRVELARRMGLTRAAVTVIVNDLLATEIIREAGGIHSHSGRPPVVLEIDPTRGFVVGIDFGASHLSILIADLGANILEEIEIAIDIQDGPKDCIDQANQLLHELLKKSGKELEDILAIGVGVPGPIVSDAGMVLAPPIMPGWDRFPIRDTLERMWGCPVSLSNDSELGALGEWAAGAGRGEQNLAYIKIGTGIGAGLLLDGQIYRGVTGSAGEIGHLTIEENGPLCACGNHGCLEAIAGGRAIAQQAQEAAQSAKRTQLANIKPIESITARDVASAARLGDLLCPTNFEPRRYLCWHCNRRRCQHVQPRDGYNWGRCRTKRRHPARTDPSGRPKTQSACRHPSRPDHYCNAGAPFFEHGRHHSSINHRIAPSR